MKLIEVKSNFGLRKKTKLRLKKTKKEGKKKTENPEVSPCLTIKELPEIRP